MSNQLEYCDICDEPTGKAGQSDDSLVCWRCGKIVCERCCTINWVSGEVVCSQCGKEG